MTDALVEKVLGFFELHQLEGPFLLAYSGGVDSKALLYLLIEAQKRRPFSLSIAHVDHSLRETSSSEAKMIEKEAKDLSIPFYSRKLKLKTISNLEEKCRDLRHEFYEKICRAQQISTVLIAHQADDVAETTFKRVLEGANLTRISGIQAVSKRQSYQIARPLLGIWKEELVKWLKIQNLSAFEDPTNYGDGNLRAKMRSKIFPDLEDSFGKQVKVNFWTLSKRGDELSGYLDERVSCHLQKMRTGPWGSYLDCRDIHPFELTYLILKILADEKVRVSRQEVQLLNDWLTREVANKGIQKFSQKIWVDRGCLFVQKKPFLKGNWKLRTEDTDLRRIKASDWKELWLGRAWAIVPKGAYKCRNPRSNEIFRGQLLKKCWSEKKTPHFLREVAPIIDLNGKIVGDFLSGQIEVFKNHSSLQKIHLFYE